MPRRKDEIEVHPEYLVELRRRVEALGVGRVAVEASMSRTSVWALLGGRVGPRTGQRHRPTIAAAMRVRDAVARMSDEPLPPPITFTLTRGPAHVTWRAALKSAKRRQ